MKLFSIACRRVTASKRSSSVIFKAASSNTCQRQTNVQVFTILDQLYGHTDRLYLLRVRSSDHQPRPMRPSTNVSPFLARSLKISSAPMSPSSNHPMIHAAPLVTSASQVCTNCTSVTNARHQRTAPTPAAATRSAPSSQHQRTTTQQLYTTAAPPLHHVYTSTTASPTQRSALARLSSPTTRPGLMTGGWGWDRVRAGPSLTGLGTIESDACVFT